LLNFVLKNQTSENFFQNDEELIKSFLDFDEVITEYLLKIGVYPGIFFFYFFKEALQYPVLF
jgi:hypothetical protein